MGKPVPEILIYFPPLVPTVEGETPDTVGEIVYAEAVIYKYPNPLTKTEGTP